GSRNKYEYSKKAGIIKLDRVLYSPLHYPGDYGFIPQSFAEDGDPMDVLVMMNEATFPGCVVEARTLGMLKMIDKGEPDYKVLAVPATDPFFSQYERFEDVPKHYLEEVKHFFMTYKQLEGATVENQGWVGTDETRDSIIHAIRFYREAFPPHGSDV
ncbi:MAG: inorganic diphosphatase, partial [Anaerolineae bacterium]|nr:inorganic diphosphatase [Anaerolineae bacterium]